MERSPVPLEELLQHAGWLRGLAASLVRDPGQADDLVQDTWLAALRHPPLAGASPRPWLERVFRNLARNRHRSGLVRAEHEARAEAQRPSPSPDAIAQEVEAQRLLAEAVGRLAEPARTIVVLRYFRGLDASAIGRELALPAGTVRWRLKGALEELRGELDRRFEGGRKAWSLVLARVLAQAAPAAGTATILWLAAGAAAFLIVGAGWWSLRRGVEEERTSDASETTDLEPAGTIDSALAAQDGSGASSELLDGAARTPLEVLARQTNRADRGPDIRGTVLVDGAPPEEAIDLELELFGTLLVDGAPATGSIDRDRFLDDAGVLDWKGHERKGGEVRRLVTDDAGHFEVFAAGNDTVYTLRAPGYLLESEGSEIWATPSRLTPDLDLVLELRTPPAIRGRIVTPDGQPVPGAHGVHHLRAEVSGWSLEPGRGELDCDGDGRFEIALLDLMWEGMPKMKEEETCEATLLFEVPRTGRRLLETGPFPPADLDLGDVALEPVFVLPFLVRDEHGTPLAGAVARLDDSWLAAPSNPTNREGRGELRHVPDREVRVRFSALGYADRVLNVGAGDRPEVWLEPVPLLEVQLEPPENTYGFPLVVLTAHDPLFESTDAPRWELDLYNDSIQGELGATPHVGHQMTKDASGWLQIARFQPDAGGKVLISGLRPDVSFTLETRDPAGRVLVRRELALARGERKRLALPYGE